jgi:phosphodiesterase/alkaline phosphatase D-like protein
MSVPSLTPYVVTYISTDSSGNVGTATRNVFVDDASKVTFDITATAGANGTITPSGVTAVTTHTDQVYAITPSAGYSVATLSVDNVALAPATTYTFSNVTATHTIAATFAKVSDVTPPVITLIGTNPMSAALGSTFVDPGATAIDAVDGGVGVTTTGTVNANAIGVYTLTYSAVDSSGNQSLLTRTVNIVLASTYDITATVGANGTITPSGVTAVTANANQAYAITPSAGYSVATLSVDNVALAPATAYTFSNVTAAHTIAATFAAIATGGGPPIPQIGFNSAISQGLENAGTVTIPVSITSVSAADVTVSFAVSGGTAVGGGVDYTLANGTLTIPSGQTSANIPLVLVNSSIFGPTKTVIITLSNPVNAALGINTVNTFYILNSNAVVINTGNNVKSTSAVITWTTADYTDSKVEYGTVDPGADLANPAAGAYNLAKYNATPVLDHRIYLSHLTPSTHYFFRTISTDLSLVVTTSTSDFTTTPGPVLSTVSSGSVTDTSSTISWTTDIPATSYVTYSVNPDLSSPVRFGSDELVTSHSVVLVNLDSVKSYFYKVESADAALNGNLGEETNDEAFYTFVTTADITPPVISEITVPIITPLQAAVIWKTNEVADGKVKYGLNTGSYENESTLITTPMSNHLAALSGLTASTKYYYVVVSSDGSGNSSTSPEQTFTTTAPNTVFVDTSTNNAAAAGVTQELYDILLAENAANKALIKPIDIVPPVISNVQISGITAFGATVSFETDKDTVAFIEYGKDHNYGLLAADQNFAKTHSIKLDGLTLGTDYFLKINAMDKSNNVGTSDEQTFKTQFLSENLAELQKIDNVEQFQAEIESTIQSILPSLVAPFIDKPVVSDITENSATVSFHTNIKSYPIVSYTTDSNYDAAKTNPYDGEISDTSEKAVSHTLAIIGLQANTKYHAMAKAFSLPQVVGKSDDFTFTTAASKVKGSIVGIKKDSFTVVWVTNEPTSSIVEYKNLKTGISSRVVDDVKNTSHSVLIENLSPGTSYQVSISGINGSGNLVEGAAPINAKTSIDNIPPVITNLKFNSALVAGRTDIVQTIISWQTDEPATSIVHYEQGSSTSNLEPANKQEDLELTKNHVVILTALKPGTVYRYAVDSTDAANNTTNSPIRTTITPKQGESIVDIILKNFNSTFNFINNVK